MLRQSLMEKAFGVTSLTRSLNEKDDGLTHSSAVAALIGYPLFFGVSIACC